MEKQAKRILSAILAVLITLSVLSFGSVTVSAVTINTKHDLETLRYNADFEMEVSEGVYWIPVKALGGSRYTNEEMKEIFNTKPEEKQNLIDTLYEAIQLYQVGGFKDADYSNSYFWKRASVEGNIAWQHGLTGYDAVRTNQGDCEASSNWLSYILKDSYDEMGFIHYAYDDNSGHVWNYIKQDGWYYFLDMTHYRTDFYDGTATETGLLTDYYDSDYVLGNIHKTKSVKAYVDYILAEFNTPPVLVYMYSTPNILVTGNDIKVSPIVRLLQKVDGVKYNVIFDNKKLKYDFTDPPRNIPDWSDVPSNPVIEQTPTEAPNLSTAAAWARGGIQSAFKKGFIPTDIQGNYTNTITRAEFCRMAVKWLEYKRGKGIDAILIEKGLTRNPNAFSDTNDSDILAAYALGVTSGTTAPTNTTSGVFTPNGEFNREQAATMIMNTCKVLGMNVNTTTDAGFTDINTASSWAVNGINFCRNNSIMNGTSTTPLLFSPKSAYTREQSIITFDNIK